MNLSKDNITIFKCSPQTQDILELPQCKVKIKEYYRHHC
jgi:hypothetical protein